MSLQRVSLEHELITKRTGGIQVPIWRCLQASGDKSVSMSKHRSTAEKKIQSPGIYKVVYLREYGTEPP